MVFIFCLHRALEECKMASCCQLCYFQLRASQTWPLFYYLQIESPLLQGADMRVQQGKQEVHSLGFTLMAQMHGAWSRDPKTQHFHTIFFTNLLKCHTFYEHPGQPPHLAWGKWKPRGHKARPGPLSGLGPTRRRQHDRMAECKELGLSAGCAELWTSALSLTHYVTVVSASVPSPLKWEP